MLSRMTLPTAFEVASTIEQCRTRVPGLRIIWKTDCGGAEWIADHCCNAVLLPAQLPDDRILDAIRHATDALVADTEFFTWVGAGLLPAPRGAQWHDMAG